MGGDGSGRKKEIILDEPMMFIIDGLGQITPKTLKVLIEKNWVDIKIKSEILEQFNEYDSILIDDKSEKIIIKGIKKLMEI